jgi:hypothetical protein
MELSLTRQFVPLAGLFTDGQQGDTGTGRSKNHAVVNFPHHRELHQVSHLGIHVGTDVDKAID